MLTYCILKVSGTLRHNCAAGIDYLLKREVENLVKVATVIQGRVLGLCLDYLRKDQLSSLTKSSGELSCHVRHSRLR
jgi:hypothetical protein